MLDTVFNALPVVAPSGVDALTPGDNFLFEASPVNFFEADKPEGNRITYFRRVEQDLRNPASPHPTVNYTRVFDTLECDPAGSYLQICSTSKAYQDQVPYEVKIKDNDAPEGARHAAYSPSFVSIPASASQCLC